MTISRQEAQALCTDVEFQLYTASMGGRLESHSAQELGDFVDRARRARDKYTDLAHRQQRKARGQEDPRGQRPAQGNDRTQAKVDLFQDVLERFEARLAEVET